MKRNLIIAATLLLGLGTFNSCTDRFNSMNTDPGAVTEANLKYILPYVQEVGAHVDCTPYQRADNLYAQMYCQYFANADAGFTSDRYGYNDAWSDEGFWQPYYLTLKHMKVAKDVAAENPEQGNTCQMIRIMQACWTAGMTDCFGDIPYSTAGLGDTKNKYDSQESIYTDIFKELTEACNFLKQDEAGQETLTGNNDLLFAGDVQKWIRFANSLRLRYALRISNIAPSVARQEGEAALASGVMTGNADNAYMTCSATGDWGWGHPLYMMSSWNGFTMSKAMENILKNESTVPDPRLELWFGRTEAYVNAVNANTPTSGIAEFAGMENGLEGTEMGAFMNYSPIWGLLPYPSWNSEYDNTDLNNTITLPLKIMTYGEVCFLKAEAALLGWSGAGNAKDNYEAGIRASLADERSFLSDASLSPTTNDDTYITTGNVAWNESDGNEAKLEKIATQKWLSLYPNGIEAWAEVRRTGYPKLIPVKHSLDANINPAQKQFVSKIRYTDDERRENAENATNASLNQNQGDGMHVRVWWDTGRQTAVQQ